MIEIKVIAHNNDSIVRRQFNMLCVIYPWKFIQKRGISTKVSWLKIYRGRKYTPFLITYIENEALECGRQLKWTPTYYMIRKYSTNKIKPYTGRALVFTRGNVYSMPIYIVRTTV